MGVDDVIVTRLINSINLGTAAIKELALALRQHTTEMATLRLTLTPTQPPDEPVTDPQEPPAAHLPEAPGVLEDL